MNNIQKGSPGPDISERFPKKAPFVDGHVDLPYFIMNHAKETSFSTLSDAPFTRDKAKKSGIRLFCTSLYCEDRFNGKTSFGHFQDILNFTLDKMDSVDIIKNGPDLHRLKQDDEGMGTIFLLENGDALAGNLSYIGQLKERGIGIVGLTHVGKNRLADGNVVTYSDGLTREGIEVIRVLNENGLLIDVAHLHPRCFWQLMKISEAPFISSHTGIRKICDIPRNIDLEQAKEIFDRGGMVGITFNPEMLSQDRKAGAGEVFAHLDTLVQKFSPEKVGIGSDLCGFDIDAEDMGDITGITVLIEIMRAHGYGETDVHHIMGLNWLNLFEKHLF